jgi:hypothetical protein
MESPNRKTKEYSKFELIFGNLAIILWIVSGAMSFWFFYPLVAIVFFISAAFLVFYELGKHGCSTCYYCKTCTIGMGKLPELFFAKGGTANVNKRAMKQFPFIYLLLSLVPLVFLVISILETFTIFKIAVLILLLIFSIYSGVVRRKNIL